MSQAARKTLIGALALVALGCIVGVANNLFAGSTRHLDWVASYPPKGKAQCPDTLPEAGAAPVEGATSTAGATTSREGAPVPVETTTAPVEAMTPTPIEGTSQESAPAGPTGPAAPAATTAPAAKPPAPTPPAVDPNVVIPPVPPDKQWLELTPPQVKALHAKGTIFVDARRSSQYEEGHIPGAISISFWESGKEDKVKQLAFETQGDPTKPIVVYCNGGDCEDSHNIADLIWQDQHTAVYVYKDGFPDWQDSGMPVTKGAAR
jgi:rhodanese-related sulfurtransferase